MNTTSQAILQTALATDSSLSAVERDVLQRLLKGEAFSLESARIAADQTLLVTQKKAAELLSVSRVTVWRMSKDGVLHPVEILPGTWRYPFHEITRLAQRGAEQASVSPREQAGVNVASAA